MKIEELPLGVIDYEDEIFRISEDLNLPRLDASLQAIGQVNPVVLVECASDQGLRIVCGFRRLHALRRLKSPVAAVKLLNATGRSPADIFLQAVWDNVSHRELNPLESARILFTLKHACEVDDQVLVERILPLLGLQPHRKVLSSYLDMHRLHPALRRLLNEGRLTLSSAERLARLPQEQQAAVWPVVCRIRLSASLQRKVLDLVDELAAMTGGTPAALLCQSEILEIVENSRLSAFQKGEKIHEWLYRRRSPRLSKARDAFLAEKAGLRLPGTVRLSPDPFFETPRIRVEFEASSARAFRSTVEALARSSRESALDRLFEVF